MVWTQKQELEEKAIQDGMQGTRWFSKALYAFPRGFDLVFSNGNRSMGSIFTNVLKWQNEAPQIYHRVDQDI
jgi:hypothetical protein